MEWSDQLSEVFTKERMRIIEAIRDNKPESIGKLSKLLNRDIAAVHRDLKILEKYEIIRLEKSGRVVKPVLDKSSIFIQIVPENPEIETEKTDYAM
jgi:predicted transcriptional regulator